MRTAWELPPRARRIPISWLGRPRHGGTTSACAENTNLASDKALSQRNYLRVRGEYLKESVRVDHRKELPPRARRIQPWSTGLTLWSGTTSACAENTQQTKPPRRESWNYLRVRGEYGTLAERMDPYKELPPRARRIRGPKVMENIFSGTTSACAENTPPPPSGAAGAGNYLRVRGEYVHNNTRVTRLAELPPRARRIR